MRATPLLLALVLSTAALAFVPSAEATNRCTFLDSWCWGLVCYHNGHQWSCVYEPDLRRLLCNDVYCVEDATVPALP